MGTVRGFLSVLICAYFWIVLLYPADQNIHAPLAHFFLISLVFLAFASHPLPESETRAFLPWFMRLLFVGGSVAVVAYSVYKNSTIVGPRLTPSTAEIAQWPVYLACFSAGFGIAQLVRFVLGRRSELFATIRAWMGVIAVLLSLFEMLLQFVIIPEMSDKPGPEVLQIWEGFLIAMVAGYFGSRT
jgi:hypothetical protein